MVVPLSLWNSEIKKKAIVLEEKQNSGRHRFFLVCRVWAIKQFINDDLSVQEYFFVEATFYCFRKVMSLCFPENNYFLRAQCTVKSV
jgi:plasmid replication initiation protein